MSKTYKVKAGDCISNISNQNGFFWETVWNAPENSDLKALRKDPNVLLTGDVVIIPDVEAKSESCAGEAKHSFVVKGVPAKMKFKFLLDDEPFANVPFSLSIDSEFSEAGESDGDGFVAVSIPPSAKACKVILGPPEDRHIFNLELGLLDPSDTDEGAMKRLFNLGFAVDGDPADTIKNFQESQQLSVTQSLDDATRAKLKEVFGQ